jgi:hypothetical protein
MKNVKITDKRFSKRISKVSRSYGFKTLGKFYRFLKQLEHPSVKLYYGTSYVRANTLINEINIITSHRINLT